jgi:hypothetical protein
MTDALDLDTIERLTGGKLGTYDVPCPVCGPYKSTRGQRRKVLRVWQIDAYFASFHCARCGERGHAREASTSRRRPIDRAAIARAKAEADERERIATADRLEKARWLWSQRQPIDRSAAERYLREARGYHGLLSATLAYLPARGEYTHAMIAAFGTPTEPDPGVLAIADAAVRGVHLTRLNLDGSDRDRGDGGRIIIGRCIGTPIVVAPPNDLLGLSIAEGIENALSAHEAAGSGAWAAGGWARMAALADAAPPFIDCVTVYADADPDGQCGALELAERLDKRGFEVFVEGVTR